MKFYMCTIYIDESTWKERIKTATCDTDMINEVVLYHTMEEEVEVDLY